MLRRPEFPSLTAAGKVAASKGPATKVPSVVTPTSSPVPVPSPTPASAFRQAAAGVASPRVSPMEFPSLSAIASANIKSAPVKSKKQQPTTKRANEGMCNMGEMSQRFKIDLQFKSASYRGRKLPSASCCFCNLNAHLSTLQIQLHPQSFNLQLWLQLRAKPFDNGVNST